MRAPEPAPARAPEPEPEPEQVERSKDISDSKPPISFNQVNQEPLSVASFLKNPPSIYRDIYDLIRKLQAEVAELKQAKALQANIPIQEDDISAPAVQAPPETPSKALSMVEEEEDRREALELLRLADLKREQNLALSQIDVRPVTLTPAVVSPVHATPQPVSTPRVNGTTPPPATPQTSSGFFGSMWSTLKSSVWSTPKPKPSRPSSNANTPTASASTPIAPPVIGELTMTLTPTPTPVGDNRGNTKVKRSSGRRDRAAIIRNVASSIRDPTEEEQVTKWADKVLMQLLQDASASTGEKRKRLEEGMTYGDLNHFTSKPWKSTASSFGLDDELMDHVDNTPDEPAPMWAVLEHLRIEQQWKDEQQQNGAREQEDEADQRAAKKQKVTKDIGDDFVSSLNQQSLPLDHASSPFYNSGGRSTSLRDLHPRSCLDRPSAQQDSNIFKKSQQTATQEDSSSTAFPTSFSVPDDSDSDEDEDYGSTPAVGTPYTNGASSNMFGASSGWTQQPPPAPVMPHAELPTSIGQTPSVPAVEGHLVASPTVDRVEAQRVEAQRAKALKFTPAKPSNLSHMSKPSPSLRSDAGNESMIANSPAPAFQNKAFGITAPKSFQSLNPSSSNGSSLLQNQTLGNTAPPPQDKNSSNGTSLFQNKSLTNGTSLFQTENLSNGTTEVMSAGASLALPDFGAVPDAESLDLPAEIERDLDNYVPSAEFQAQLQAMNDAWSDPIIEYEYDEASDN